jgi:hypothetical protein
MSIAVNEPTKAPPIKEMIEQIPVLFIISTIKNSLCRVAKVTP